MDVTSQRLRSRSGRPSPCGEMVQRCRAAAKGRAGEISPKALLLLLFVAVAVGGFIWKQRQKSAPPIQILEKRVVATDIENYNGFRRLLAMAQSPLGGSAFGNALAGPAATPKIVAMRDEQQGGFIFVRVRLAQKFMEQHDTAVGLRDFISGTDFQLAAGKQAVDALFLFSGLYEEKQAGSEKQATIALPAAKVTQVSNGGEVAYEVAGEDFGAGIEEDNYQRKTLLERLTETIRGSIKDNVWRAELQVDQEEGWAGTEVVCLFPIPEGGGDLKLVVFNDGQNAVPLGP